MNQVITQKSVRIAGMYTFWFLESHTCVFKWACTRRFDSQPTDVQGGPLYPWLQLMFVKWQQVTPGMWDCHIDLFT